jgi:hypothetical protein
MDTTRRIVTLAALCAATATAHAQEIDMGAGTPAPPAPAAADEAFHKGTLGFALPLTLITNVAASVIGVGERVPTIDLVYFLSDKAALDVIGGVNFHRKQGVTATGTTVDTNVFGFAAGLGYRMYSSKNNLRSFIEPQGVLSWPDTQTSSTFSLAASVAFGLERNLTPWFSFTGAVGGGVAFTNSFKDIQLATSANLAANLYWR